MASLLDCEDMKHPVIFIIIVIFVIIIAFVATQFLIIKYRGSYVPAPEIPRQVQTVGEGDPLRYAVMGDSTSISQGSKYADGFAAHSASHLAKKFAVTWVNTGISGATTEDVRDDQLQQAVAFQPDIVLLAVGGNDATHFIGGAAIKAAVQDIIDALRTANPDVQIIVTASPAMDSVTRFPIGSKQVMALRTKQVNAAFADLIKDNNLVHAPIAEKTRDAFIADPTLTAADQFHPNKRGYALWIPVINAAIDTAVARRN